MRLEGGTRPGAANEPAVQQLRAAGTLTAEGLRQAPELGFVSRLARDFTGGTGYALGIAFRRGTPRQVTSNLQGLGINLPAPLNKAVETALPVRYETALTRESLLPGARLQETLVVELDASAACIMCATSTAPSRRWCGTIALGLAPGEHVAMPAEGVMANIQLGDFNVDAWEDALAAPPLQTAAPAARRCRRAASASMPAA